MGTGLENAVERPAGRGWLASLVVLLASIAGGAALRLESLGEPSLWLDEILGFDLTTAAASHPWWMWITGFDAEHGPLYYAAQLAGRIAERPEVAARWVPALLGTATIALVWLAGRFGGARYSGAAAAAAILATSPLHIYYSREGRPYALAIAIAAAMIVALLQGRRHLFAVLVIAAVYTSAIAAPLLAAAAVVAFACGLLQSDSAVRRRDWMIASLAALGTAAVPLLYGLPKEKATGVDFPEITTSFADSLVRAFGVTAIGSGAHGRTAVVLLLIAIIGAVDLVRRDRRRGVIVIGMTVLPVALALAALSATDHWFAVRYVSTALPGYVVLAGAGIAAVAGLATSRLRFGWIVAWVVVIVAAALLWMQTVPVARHEPYQKLDWRKIASLVANRARPDDVIVTAEGWSTVSLRFYLRQLGSLLRLVEVTEPGVVERMSADGHRLWLVTAGHTTDSRVREWICRFPIVLASPLEEFRLHYAPGLADFLRERSTIFERRAVAGDALTLGMSSGDAIFLGESWSTPEGEGEDVFRWIAGRRAVVAVPLTGQSDRVLRMRVSPLEHRGLPPQTMRVALNGETATQLTLAPGVHDYSLEIAAPHWRANGANVLELEFARANAPADLDPAQRDRRPLSAAFHSIEIHEARATATAPGVLRTVRLHDDGSLLDERTVWRDAEPRLQNLDRSAVEALLSRLGYDPVTLWPRVAAGEVAVERLIETLASSSACESDVAFITRTWQTIFAREPNQVELRVLLSLLKVEGSRLRLIERISRMTEFHAALTS
ncbi:MAG TPA: hypothetical protein VM779_04395 [Thermoanaerobaculia bacterium]|nr:hypothetical protein [Thermoanaerobaculia bacterium]